jgi:hypothetical protein
MQKKIRSKKMVWVVKSEVKDGYKIFIEFNDGTSGIIDFYDKIANDHRQIFRDLLDLDLFRTARTDLDTVCWDNEADFAPEYLYEQIKMQQQNVA